MRSGCLLFTYIAPTKYYKKAGYEILIVAKWLTLEISKFGLETFLEEKPFFDEVLSISRGFP